jgi:hypothetical protein
MQYALLIYRQPGDWDGLSEAEMAELGAEYWKLRAEPGVTDGAGLLGTETATTLRMEDGKALVTDGPFADTKEYLAGFYVLDVPDLDAATELAARIPAVRQGGSVEIRPIMDRT